MPLLAPSMSLPDTSVFLWLPVLHSTCVPSVSAMLHSDSPLGFECHLQVGPSMLNYFVYPCLSCLWACVSVCTLLCTHACLFVRVYVCDYVCLRARCFLCVSVCLGPCLSDSAVCLTVSVSAPPPLLVVSCSLANPHSLSLSLFLSPFHSPSSSPALSPSSSLCNNSADLVSACSVLPVEFYSGLPSWLLCCLKTQAEKHD